jgi:hypothetical protein
MADFEVIFMDAGQGDCTLIVYPDGSLTLVDCGSTKSGSAAIDQIKEVMQRKFNKKSFFTVVLTHPDEDHYNLLKSLDIYKYLNSGASCGFYFGGHVDLYGNAKDGNYVKQLLTEYMGYNLAGSPHTTSTMPDGMLTRAGVSVTILAANCTGKPAAANGHDKNTNSIVLLVEYQGAKIFLMGDAFEQTEAFIVSAFTKANQLKRLQKQTGEHVVLKMGHHGSDTSSHADWVKLIGPEVLVVSAGTRTFGGKGMPTKAHLSATVGNTKLNTTDIDQSYVVFDEANRGKAGLDFVTMPKTKQAIWTTCYGAVWQNAAWFESGQTWYYGVEKSGKKASAHWYGYTGYET